jgi:hypothetical protein
MVYYHPPSMKKYIVIIVLLAAASAFAQTEPELSATAEQPVAAERPSMGQVTAFFPAGGEISLEGPAGEFRLESGRALECPVGEYLLSFRHPDYADYMRKVAVRSDAPTLILPELEHTGAYWAGQASALEGRRAAMAKTRNAMNGLALAGGALSVASAAAVGAVEWLLSSEKSRLDATYDEYRSASAADAPGIWARIEDQKAGISRLRLYEYLAVGGAGLFAGAGSIFASSAPTVKNIDWSVLRLRKEAGK